MAHAVSAALTRRMGQLVGDLSRVLRVCGELEDLDRRATLLDAAGRMLEAVRDAVLEARDEERRPILTSIPSRAADGTLQLLALVREVHATYSAQARECEAALRHRSRLQLADLDR
jgi:hypothetical protein